MAQDTDVARVAAALRAPGIRYRSFGNEPVRTPPAGPGGDYSLLGAGLSAAADVAAQQGQPGNWGEAAATSATLPPIPAPAATVAAPQPWAEAPPAAWAPPPAAAPVQAWSEPATVWTPPPAAVPAPASWNEPAPPIPQPAPLPAPTHWDEPAQPAWSDLPPPSWAAAPPAEAGWSQPAAPAWPEPAASWTATPAPPLAPAPAPVAAAPVEPPKVAAPAPVAPAAAQPASRGELTLLRAVDAPHSAPVRAPLPTLLELGTAPPPAAPAAAPDLAPASFFPLIDALDLPGGFGLHRPVAGTAGGRGAPAAPAAPLPAAEVTMPLAELFRLLANATAAGETRADPSYALLRGSPTRAAGHAT
jgi:hypothetical protein